MLRKLVIIFVGGVLLAVGIYAYVNRQIPFSSEAWKANVSQRPRMVQNLLADYDLKAKSRDDIDELLGVSTAPPDAVVGDQYIYWAGTDGVIDDMWLEITFKQDQVVDVRYVPD